jgi:hypothetical protein
VRDFFPLLRLKSLRRFRDPSLPAWQRWFFIVWDGAALIWWRGIYGPLRMNYQYTRQRLARGNVSSYYWTPGLGDRVDACMSPKGARVVFVSIRRDLVKTEDGREHSLVNCCSPHEES